MLEPPLFLIYVNDMPQNPLTPIVQYADSINPCSLNSQRAVIAYKATWMTLHRTLQNCLRINTQKGDVMCSSRSRTAGRPTYMVLGTPLAVPEPLSILGVTFFPPSIFLRTSRGFGRKGSLLVPRSIVALTSFHYCTPLWCYQYWGTVVPSGHPFRRSWPNGSKVFSTEQRTPGVPISARPTLTKDVTDGESSTLDGSQ